MSLIHASALWVQVLSAATSADFKYPIFVATGARQTIWVADQDIPAIFELTADGKATRKYTGTTRYRTVLYRPRGLALDQAGNLYVCCPATLDVYKLDLAGKLTPLSGKPTALPDGRTVTMGDTLIQPEGIAVDAAGQTIFVSDMKHQAIFRYRDGRFVKLADVPAPRGIALDRDGTLLVVSNSAQALKRVNLTDGKVVDVMNDRPMGFPMSIAVRPDGKYVVTDNYTSSVWLVDRAGKASKLLTGEPLRNPTGVAIRSDGKLVIADSHAKTIFIVGADNKPVAWPGTR